MRDGRKQLIHDARCGPFAFSAGLLSMIDANDVGLAACPPSSRAFNALLALDCCRRPLCTRQPHLAHPMDTEEGPILSSQQADSGGGTSGEAVANGKAGNGLLTKRRMGETESASGAPTEEVDTILSLCGPVATAPETVEHKKVQHVLLDKTAMPWKAKSAAWGFLKLYQADTSQRGSGKEKDVVALCLLCLRLGKKDTKLMLSGGNVSNAIKHLRQLGSRDMPTMTQLVHSRAALYVSKNVTGGSSSARGLVEAPSINRFLTPKTDRRSHHVGFVLMQVMTFSPHSFASHRHVRGFFNDLASYTPPAPNTVVHHLAELYDCLLSEVRNRLSRVKKLFGGLPFAHVVTDLWTEEHTNTSFGSVVVRFVDPEDIKMEVVRLGVSLFVGRHDNATIKAWLLGRLAYFGLAETDICSTTTDSGANVRKAMRQLAAPWLPCFSHSLHNAVKYAVGGPSEARPLRGVQQASTAGGMQQQRSQNPGARTLLAKLRKLFGHFNHSEVSVAIYKDLVVPHAGKCRTLVTDVPTRWSSTYNAMARLYTCFSRLMAFFSCRDVGAGVRRRRLSMDEWDRMRQVMGILRCCYEVTTRTESATLPVSSLLSLLASLRRAVNSDQILVPCLPGQLLAEGECAMKQYIEDHPSDAVLVVDNNLYPAEYLHVGNHPVVDSLCQDASTAVLVLREQLELRFFNKSDESRNVLRSNPVLASSVLSPGGPRLLQSTARLLGETDPLPHALELVKNVCDKYSNLSPTAPPVPAAPGRAAATAGKAWKRARSCLVDSSDEEGSYGGSAAQGSPSRSELAKAQLESVLHLPDFLKKGDALEFWMRSKHKFPDLAVVACSLLGAVGSSAAAERDFSLAGNVMSKNRSTLLPQHLEMHSLIRENVDLLPKVLKDVPVLSAEQAAKLRKMTPLGGCPQVNGDGDNLSSDEDGG